MRSNEKNDFFTKNMRPSETEGRRADTMCPWCKSRNGVIREGIFTCPRCSYAVDVSGHHEIEVIGWTFGNDNDYPECDCKTTTIYQAIVKEIKEKGYSFGWLEHRCDDLPCTPVINNGYKVCCGPKTWASIMAEAHTADLPWDALCAEYEFGCVNNPVLPPKGVNYDLIIPFGIEE